MRGSPLTLTPDIRSVLASGSLGQIDALELIHERSQPLDPVLARGALNLRVGRQKRYVALYRSGRLRAAGCASVPEAQEILESVAVVFGRRETIRSSFRVENMVATIRITHGLNLEQVTFALPERIEYEPQQFPGMILQLSARAKALLFSTGKVVITGCTSREELSQSVAELEHLLAAL